MALDATILTEAIVTALLLLPVDPTNPGGATYGDVMSNPADPTQFNQVTIMRDTIQSQMEKLIEHIIANAVVTVSMAIHTHSGVTTGPGISGPPIPGISEVGSAVSIPPGGIT